MSVNIYNKQTKTLSPIAGTPTSLLDNIQESMAPVEASSTSASAYAVGDYLLLQGQLYEVTASIAIGDTIVEGTNVSKAVLSDAFNSGGGGGAGDMTKAVYDNNNSVANAGGISAFVAGIISGLATVARTGAYADLTGLPTIPTVNDGRLTIQQNGTAKGYFNANQSGNVTANIITDTWTTSTTVSNGAFSFSGLDDTKGYAYEPYFNITGSSTNKNPTARISTITGAGTASMSIAYTTDADEGSSVKLRVIK